MNTLTLYPLILKLSIALIAGFIPVLVWLWFWEHEDKYPEPRSLVATAFVTGIAAVIIALVLEEIVVERVSDYSVVLFLWATIEEVLKFGLAYFTVLSRTENDEPIDNMMYMITVALGFSALENALFLFKPIYTGAVLEALATGNTRFVGATLLHTITSGLIGLALALTFYEKNKLVRRFYIATGVITAIVLHTFFNLSIIIFEGSNALIPFYVLWIAVIAILLAFEKVKRITPQ